jgi:hypothetical protein
MKDILSRWKREKFITITLVTCLMISTMSLSGCNGPVDKILAAFDKAIKDLTDQSKAWQTTLKTLMNELKGLTSYFMGQVDLLRHRGTTATAELVLCSGQFIRERMLDGVKRLRAEYLNEPYPAPEPKICLVYPSPTLDRAKVPDEISDIEIFGFDLYANDAMVALNKPSVYIYLYNYSGKVKNVSHYLNRAGNFQIVLPLEGRDGVKMDDDSANFTIMRKTSGSSSMAVYIPPGVVYDREIRILHPEMPPNCEHILTFLGNLSLVDGDWWSPDEHGTKRYTREATLTDEDPVDMWTFPDACADEVGAEVDIYSTLNPYTGNITVELTVFAKEDYSDTSATCGGSGQDFKDIRSYKAVIEPNSMGTFQDNWWSETWSSTWWAPQTISVDFEFTANNVEVFRQEWP